MSRRFTYYYILLSLLLTVTEVKSDDFADQGNISSLSAPKLSGTPVNYLKGVPSISIPLMNISDRDVNVEVSLSYDASGIKVSQDASTVGLGWSLIAGGIITRDSRGGIYDAVDNMYNDFVELEWGTSIEDCSVKQIYNPHPSKEEALALYNFSHDGREINSPDVFSFSFCGHSGKFYLDYDLVGHLFSYEEISIKMVDDTTFLIIDDKGFAYTFKGLECNDNDNYPETWYLTTIVSPAGGKVDFKYVDASYYVYKRICRGDIYEEGFAPVHEIDFQTQAMRQKYQCNKYELVKEHLMQLEAIIAGKSRISFGLESANNTNNNDGNGVIVNNLSKFNSHGNKVKEYKLNYENFGYYPNVNNYMHKNTVVPIHDDYTSIYYRLKLTSIEEVSPITGKNGDKIEFAYHGEDPPFYYHLPAKNGYQDHYGYSTYVVDAPCNFLFPSKNVTDDGDRPSWYKYIRDNAGADIEFNMGEKREFSIKGGANRNPDEQLVKAGSLKRISYPEGGWTEFDYESHKAYFASGNDTINKGGIRVKSITDNDGMGKEIKREYSYNSYYWFQGYTGDLLSFRYFTVLDPEFSGVSKYKKDFSKGYYSNTTNNSSQEQNQEDESSTKLIISPYPVPEEFEDGFIYTSVTERVIGGGKIEYRFSSPDDTDVSRQIQEACPFYKDNTLFLLYGKSETDSSVVVKTISKNGSLKYGDFPYLHIAECPWAYGDLVECIAYDENGAIMNTTKYEYEHKLLDAIPSYKIAETGKCMKFKGIETKWSGFYCVDYLISGISRLKATSNTSYYKTTTKAIKTISQYEYGDSLYIDRPTSIQNSVIGGDYRYSHIRYAGSYAPTNQSTSASIQKLMDRHIVVPIEVRNLANGKTISGRQMEYNSLGQLVNIYSFTKGNPEFRVSQPYTFTKTFHYDYAGGMLFKQTNVCTGETCHYLWGYDNQYPLMKIYNYERIEGKPFNQSNVAAETEMKAPHVIYDYIPSVGLSKTTKADGSADVYEYDEFYRLKRIRKESSKGSNKTVIEYSYGINE